jgi:deoxyribodipyrimidine photo-lyase
MTAETALVWFRRDLRLHDNEALSDALAADHLLPVYCIDPRHYGRQRFGGADSFDYEKTGPYRARFRRESLADLRESLREVGSDLVVREGRPEKVVPAFAKAVDADAVYFHTYPTNEEMGVEEGVTDLLGKLGVDAERRWGHTLYHVEDLPNGYEEIPDTYTSFRKSVENRSTVRPPFRAPEAESVPPLATTTDGDDIGHGTIPTLDDLGVAAPNGADPAGEPSGRGGLDFAPGESGAMARLDRYLWEEDRLREYKETRNGLVGQGFSSKLSAWLNEGCLSPRYVEREVRRYEEQRVSNDSTYWLLFELIWRDFFQFQFAKHGTDFWRQGGIRNRTDIAWRDDETQFERWKAGETGIPFVDAAMRELNETGYVSNRARQNAASFLVNNCRIDWRKGAAYYETQLVDYDPCSNYGNWAYIAGVGNDNRDRYFNILKQAKQYDGDAEYVTHWLPELEPLPPRLAHEPWKMSDATQAEYGVELGIDYPEPMLDLEQSYEKLR